MLKLKPLIITGRDPSNNSGGQRRECPGGIGLRHGAVRSQPVTRALPRTAKRCWVP